jgi:hypothetical protein
MFVPLLGNNIVLWLSPNQFLELVDNALYRIRTVFTADQTAKDSIPMVQLLVSNILLAEPPITVEFANAYGGEQYWLDVDGGANGIGRPQGANTFDGFFTPIGVETDQWRGIVDLADSPFAVGADGLNDATLIYRVFDIGSSGYNANIDEGQICVAAVVVERIDLGALTGKSADLYNQVVDSSQYVEATSSSAGTVVDIDDAADEIDITLLTAGTNQGTIIPFDVALAGDFTDPVALNQALYPIAWNAGTLYKVEMDLSGDDTDPVDVIQLSTLSGNAEIGQNSYGTAGAPGSFNRASSPRPTVSTFSMFWNGGNGTLTNTPGWDAFRWQLDLFNKASLFGDGTGGDTLTLEGVRVFTYDTP